MDQTPMTNTRPTVLIADDNAGILDRLSTLLSERFEVVGAVRDGSAAFIAATSLHPDIVVMDIMMPYLDGIHVCREIRKKGDTSRIVFVTVNEDTDFIAEAFRSGASGYVFKSRLQSELLSALAAVLAGLTFVSPIEADFGIANTGNL
jgi:DNA-binding NarL/FixJ family response regulator